MAAVWKTGALHKVIKCFRSTLRPSCFGDTSTTAATIKPGSELFRASLGIFQVSSTLRLRGIEFWRKNRQLEADGRPTISRFHATYWSTKREEFKGWSDDEKFEFFDNLLALFYRFPVVGCAQTVFKQDIAAVFPEAAEQDRVDHLAHVLLFILIVVYIDQRLMSFKDYAIDRIAFIHDSIQFNGVFLDAFEGLKRDTGITCRDRLVSIDLKTWQEETLLQAADLIAYENYKVVERKHVGADMRLTMKKILDSDFRGRNARMTKENLQEFRQKTDNATLNAIFAQARMKPLVSSAPGLTIPDAKIVSG